VNSTGLCSRRDFLRQSAAQMAAVSALAAMPGCGRAPAPVRVKEIPDRLILVTLDTLRQDHLEYFGYPRSTAPFLAKLAERSVVFENAICSCSNTTPAHTSLLSGLHPPQHKMFHNSYDHLTPGLFMMADMFRDAGYDTAAFCSVVWMRVFDQGFAHFDSFKEKYIQDESERRYYRQAPKTVALALDWLKQRRPDDRFFLWIHLYDPHDPYVAPPECTAAMQFRNAAEKEKMFAFWTEQQKKTIDCWPYDNDRERFIEAQCGYDAEILHLDQPLRQLYEFCQKAGLNQNALWLFTADHGEGMGNHGLHGHGQHIYNEQIDCLLMMHAPDGRFAPRHVPDKVQHVDLMPTLAGIYGASLEKQQMKIQGDSLLPLLHGEKNALPPRTLFCQRRKKLEIGFSKDWLDDPIYCAVNRDCKYIRREKVTDEFYRFQDDPLELQNLAEQALSGSDAEIRSKMRDQAQAMYEALTRDGEAANENPIGHEHDDALDALGYLS
jgi:arylsulfatase A-like enzyme